MSGSNGVGVPGTMANEVEVLAKATRRRFPCAPAPDWGRRARARHAAAARGVERDCRPRHRGAGAAVRGKGAAPVEGSLLTAGEGASSNARKEVLACIM